MARRLSRWPRFEGLEDRRVPAIGLVEIPLPAPASALTSGPDGNLWYTDEANNAVGRLTPSGEATLFPTTHPQGRPGDITAGPDGNLWFIVHATALQPTPKIGRITPSGEITLFDGKAQHITAGPDGNLWFTFSTSLLVRPQFLDLRIGRITPDGTITEFAAPAGIDPKEILLGPGGHLWFGTLEASRVGRISTTGEIVTFPVPVALSSTPVPNFAAAAADIAVGPDGNLWYKGLGAIGRVTPDGQANAINNPTFLLGGAITAAADGRLWFVDSASSRVGWVTDDGRVAIHSVRLPGSNIADLQVGPDGKLYAALAGVAKIVRIDVDSADLAVSVVATPTTAGGDLTVTYTVTNVGPGLATSVLLTGSGIGQFLPLFQHSTNETPTASARSSQGAPPTFLVGSTGYEVRAELGTLAPGASATLTFVAKPKSVGRIIVRGTVAHDEPDYSPANDAAETGTDVALGVTPPTIPPPVPADVTPPRIVGINALRLGKGRNANVTGYVITFSEVVDPARAGNLGLYKVAESKSVKGKIRAGKVVRMASARASAGGNAVTISLRGPQSLPKGAILTVSASLTDLSGNRLAGDGANAATAATMRVI